MKKYLFYFLLFNLGLVITSNAQISDGADDNKNKSTLKFIEDIEINKNNPKIISTSSKKTNSSIKITSLKEVISDKSIEIEKSTSIRFKYAQRLNIEVEYLSNDSLYEFIEDWLHTKYLYGGASKSGTDCSGFTGMLEKEIFRINLPRTAGDQFHKCEKISITDAKEGDLVFFNTLGGISHVGVYLANGYFVHASSSSGVIINNLSESYYKTRFISAGRIMKSTKVD